MVNVNEVKTTRLLGVLAFFTGAAFVGLSVWIALAGVLPGEQAVRLAVIAALSPTDLSILRAANHFGDRVVLISAGLVTVMTYRALLGRGFSVALLLIAAAMTEGAAIWIMGRPRPEGVGLGYPSGHVFGSVVVYGALAIALYRGVARPAVRWTIVLGVVGLIASVALARIGLRAHWPSDVAAALLAGVTYLLLAVHPFVDRSRSHE